MMPDPREVRSPKARAAEQLAQLHALFPETAQMSDISELAALPVLRKGELCASQAVTPPLGALRAQNVSHIFQSPGPIYEPGGLAPDYWRLGRFLRAMGVEAGSVVQNTFAYHFTPAGMMFESAARAHGMTVFPAGPGNTAAQAEVAASIGTTAYIGTPDYLATILDKGAELGLDLSRITHAAVSAGPLFPQTRQAYADRGITCRQCYATADAGLIAYESSDCTDGMIIDEDVIVEIVTPGTCTPVAEGEIGEVLVTVLNPDNPLLRFSTGDLSAFMTAGDTPCGRTNRRIVGWRGRADQAAKVKGMFIRPEQVATLVARHADVARARVEVTRADGADHIAVQVETDGGDADAIAASVNDILKLRADVTLLAPGALPRDGVVIADLRPIES